MNELDPTVARALRDYGCAGVPRDWDDVLRRAGNRGRRVSLGAVAVALGLVLAAAPAFGVADELRGLLERDRPVARFTAALVGPSGLAGRFAVDTPGAFLVRPGQRRVIPVIPRRRTPRGRRPVPQAFRWTLTFRGADEAARALLLRRGRALATLCAPCAPSASGTVRLTVDEAVAVFTGRTSVRVDTSAGVLRGAVRFPRRR